MGNAQDKPSGTGGAKTDQATPGFRRRSRAGSTEKPKAGKGPPEKGSMSNGATQGDRNQSKDIPPDTSYLDAPAGALPSHLGRLKNEGNHLFKNGQFADAVEKYSAAIDGCCDAGGVQSIAVACYRVRCLRMGFSLRVHDLIHVFDVCFISAGSSMLLNQDRL